MHKRNNRLSNRMTYLFVNTNLFVYLLKKLTCLFVKAPSPPYQLTRSHTPYRLFDIISLGVDAVFMS